MEQMQQILELMNRPAFCVEAGRILAANASATARQIPLGAAVEPMLTSGVTEYREYTDGCLCLSLICCGESYDATVTMLDGRQIFTLEAAESEEELRLLSLAAQELREPLGNVLSLMEDLEGDSDTKARINRGLYQLLRVVGNMSAHPMPKMELIDVTALLAEIWEKVSNTCSGQSLKMTFHNHPMPIYSCADSDLLTRAIHNLLSNALKFTDPRGSVDLSLTVRNRAFKITLVNSGHAGIPLHTAFSRFRREPGLEDGRTGLGLGLKIVRSAALAHGGTALMDAPTPETVRVTMTIPIRQNAVGLRSTRYRISYTGERDPMLIELSDILPPECYRS